jgi:hypothetical protein
MAGVRYQSACPPLRNSPETAFEEMSIGMAVENRNNFVPSPRRRLPANNTDCTGIPAQCPSSVIRTLSSPKDDL